MFLDKYILYSTAKPIFTQETSAEHTTKLAILPLKTAQIQNIL